MSRLLIVNDNNSSIHIILVCLLLLFTSFESSFITMIMIINYKTEMSKRELKFEILRLYYSYIQLYS